MDRLNSFAPAGALRPARGNALLGGLPPGEQLRIRDHFERVPLDARSILHGANSPIENVYFPLVGVLAMLGMDETAPAIEVGSVGNEGLAGLAAIHGADVASQQCLVQVAGEALRIPVVTLRNDLRDCPVLSARILRYANCFFNDMAQSVVCTRLHTARQRCARWLLMTHDRLNAGEILLTHEFLSDMLAVRRSTVTVAMHGFLMAKVVAYSRGRLRILDRVRLEAASCPCYRARRTEYDLLIDGLRAPLDGDTRMVRQRTHALAPHGFMHEHSISS